MAIIDAIVAGERAPEKTSRAVSCKSAFRPADCDEVAGLATTDPNICSRLSNRFQAYRNYQQLSGGLRSGDRAAYPKIGRQNRSRNKKPSELRSRNAKTKQKTSSSWICDQKLYRIFGADLTAIPGISALTAHTLLAEIGPDLSRFANVAAFASWLTLCPANKKSGGKVLFLEDPPEQ